jgi:hypothetical protein
MLLNCALEDAAAWPGPVCYAPAEPADGDWLGPRIGADAVLVAQGNGNLGERINRVNRALWARGLERQLFIGIDCPSLSPLRLERADAVLDGSDIVLMPAADGGVVLMGSRRPWPALGTLPWSEPGLLDGLVALCQRKALSLRQTEMLHDVDSLDDLRAVAATLAADGRPARRKLHSWIESATAGSVTDRTG